VESSKKKTQSHAALLGCLILLDVLTSPFIGINKPFISHCGQRGGIQSAWTRKSSYWFCPVLVRHVGVNLASPFISIGLTLTFVGAGFITPLCGSTCRIRIIPVAFASLHNALRIVRMLGDKHLTTSAMLCNQEKGMWVRQFSRGSSCFKGVSKMEGKGVGKTEPRQLTWPGPCR
jgi:hypothetical protein